ncbi:tRNA epoxyqueuosine(34) reductase QueG [Haliea sp. AH-315-K21]|uniref:Epoxyqueuosine reductase n=1 Tax=SAR86 cluster bacterium TaxID=2030880 RepID=A0A2A5CIQ2_9GAMM|nr:tRNA epoxyqueuosine(34) reductase QueG [Haliea sp. AH-315-K21]MBN4075608.1 tRNA epoxyqueuosine(34) reductase QueG [Gammaproteobacteria bacterium AH-315-E17]PCJ43385.1 MAG: tRNA epoxyqueuosine(34) reductase QueG [SAR86 cluster bacterium]
MTDINFSKLAEDIKIWGRELGFQQIGISDIDLSEADVHLQNWLQNNFHGEMDYMQRHGAMRSHPELLVPGTLRIISARMDYLPAEPQSIEVLKNSSLAYISRYALGRDYHKLIRQRLQKLANKIQEASGEFGYRALVDSAPVLERAIAEKAGLGWIGKNAMLINKKAGSWFFLGELFTDLPLPLDNKADEHCGTCHACLDICPTDAFVGPNKLDARKCISYLTIELRTSIPEKLRPLMGNRVFGCDDCQLCCPWNKFSSPTQEKDFSPRHELDRNELVTLFSWTEEEFLEKTAGSPIRRIGYDCWLRNLAVGLGNASSSPQIKAALQARINHPSPLVKEHVDWALAQHAH